MAGRIVTVFLKALVLAAPHRRGARLGRGEGGALGRAPRLDRSHWQQIFVLAVAALTYTIASPLGASGFIAAWAGGCAMGRASRRLPGVRELPEDLASLLTPLSFLFFGAVYLGPALAPSRGRWRCTPCSA